MNNTFRVFADLYQRKHYIAAYTDVSCLRQTGEGWFTEFAAKFPVLRYIYIFPLALHNS
jgi:hypothetical protein